LPQLPIRTGSSSLLAASWTALEAASPACSVSLFWLDACTPPVLHPQDGPWFWVAVCVVSALLPAKAEESALLLCVTEPSLPGLSTRTDSFELLGAICFASDSAAAFWSVSADWVDACTPEPLWVCGAVCVVSALLPANAEDAAVFVWVTLPPPPRLPIRTGSFSLLAPSWTALEAAFPVWSVSLD